MKILGSGDITGAYQISAHAFSGSARTKIEAAGGSATVLSKAVAEEAAVEVVEESAPVAEVTEEAPAPEGEEASEAEEEQA